MTIFKRTMNNPNEWDLEQILPKSRFNEAINDLDKKLIDFKNRFKSVKANINLRKFKELLSLQEEIITDITLIYYRADLWEAADTSDIRAKHMASLSKDMLIRANDALRPFDLWLKGKYSINDEFLDDHNADRLFKSIPELTYYFQNERSKARYSLQEREEAIINRKDITGTNTLLDIRDQLESKQEYLLEVNGKKQIFTNIAELAPYIHSRQRKVRKDAYNSLIKQYVNNRMEYFLIYQAIVKDWNNEKDLRGYKSSISIRNIENGIDDQAVSALIEACDMQIDIFREFFKLKAKYLKIEAFDRYDIYASINGHSDKTIELEEAKQRIMSNYGLIDKEMANMVKEIFNANVIDFLPRKSKKGGGFCAPLVPKKNPFIFLNYTGINRDFMTMAHEMGHAIHSKLSGENSILTYNAPLILAETGSTIGEMVNFDNTLFNVKDKEEKISMLFEKIGDLYASIIRQIYFVKFELQAHQMIVSGCTIDDLDRAYLMNLNTQFKDALLVPEIFKHEWMYIPHIVHSPFYCYSYAFGQLLGLSLYENLLEDHNLGLEKIKTVLASGSSKDPKILLREIGYDLNNGEIWTRGFKYIRKMIKVLQDLV